MEEVIKKLQKWKKAGIIGIFLILVFIAGTGSTLPKNNQKVLSATANTKLSPTPESSTTPVPITIINNIIVPTQIPQAITPTPTPVQVSSIPTPTFTVAPTQSSSPTLSPSPTPTPTQASQDVEIEIDYATEHTGSVYETVVVPGETAWQAVQDAIGLANLQYTDYGGDLGIFITGFNEVNAASNQYYDFQVNGASSSVGVSTYIVANHDVLKFVLIGF